MLFWTLGGKLFWIFACSQGVPQHVCNIALLYPTSFALSSTLVVYITQAQKNRLIYMCFGSVQNLIKFVFCDEPINNAHCKKKKKKKKEKTNFGGLYN